MYFIITVALAAVSLNAPAQNINGGIEASKVTMTRTGDIVMLEMVLDIRKDAVTKCQSIAIAPALSNGAEHKVFQYVLVNGRNKRQIFDRKEKFNNVELVKSPPLEVVNIDKKNRGKKINYAATVPYEPWMDNASLDMELTLSSCANELQLYTMELSAVSVVATEAIATNTAPVVEATEPPKIKTAVVTAIIPDNRTVKQVSGCAYLDFEPGSSVIVPFYKRNSQELAKVHETLDKLKNDPNAEITGLSIIGYASPEGRYSTNETLAYDRARAFARYIQNKYGFPVQYSNVSAVAEDWETLRRIAVNSDVPNLNTVLSIIDSNDAPDAKESKLRRLDGGRAWEIMINEMFPRLRRVEYKVDYKVK